MKKLTSEEMVKVIAGAKRTIVHTNGTKTIVDSPISLIDETVYE